MNGSHPTLGAAAAPAAPSRRRLLALATLLPTVALTALTGCSSGTGASAEDGFAGGDGTYTQIAPDKRTPVPELSGTTLDGKKLSLSDYRGRVVVLNVWGSWCPPCRHEAPALVKAAAATKGTAQFIGINTRDLDPGPAKAFVRTAKIPYPNIYDPSGSLLLDFGALPAKAIPSTLVVDAQGRIAARILGEANATTLQGAVTDIAAGK